MRFGPAVLMLVLSGCAPTPAATVPPRSCEKADLPTLYEGVLAVGTDQPAYPPWYIGDDPANGDGFESAVAYAVADKLGYTADALEAQWLADGVVPPVLG